MTRKQRHLAYKAALIKLKYQRRRGNKTFALCIIMIKVFHDLGLEHDPNNYEPYKHKFPELWAFEPRHFDHFGYWWKSTKYKVRKKVLEYCIMVTKKHNNGKENETQQTGETHSISTGPSSLENV